jgi:gamma-carbonic anhydrase
VAPTAVLSGQVRVGPGSCVLHGAVVSADDGPVNVGANCVIMEHAVLRETPRHALTIAHHVLDGPQCYLTSCTLGDEVFIATSAMVFAGARIGRASSLASAAPFTSAVWCRRRPGFRSGGRRRSGSAVPARPGRR